MKVIKLKISNFRSIKAAELEFEDHTLLIGTNNVGKSTIFEALDLVLGPDRLSKFPSVEEFDFYNAEYIEEDNETTIPIEIEVLLSDLSEETQSKCRTHLEFWNEEEKRLLTEGEIEEATSPQTVPCLRLKTIAEYNYEEDEFEAATYYCHNTNNYDGSLEKVSKTVKRMFGFLYLRALRTGARALSLERGSLLDIILRIQSVRTGLWEQSIKRLEELDPPIASESTDLLTILYNIEKRLGQYISLNAEESATNLYVSKLTREHLRKTISFFLRTSPDQKPVPFQKVGTGTLNMLVLALLSFIAEEKKENVIFAMEEPEIALPPHTQRRIVNYLLKETTQSFVTSHSPYVIEQFDPKQIRILRRHEPANLTSISVDLKDSMREKTYRRYTRKGLAEAMLGEGVIVLEGITEQFAIRATAEKLEKTHTSCYPLDLSGVTLLAVDGEGSIKNFGAFFKSLGLKTYAFYDKKKDRQRDIKELEINFDFPNEIEYEGMEQLLITEIPAHRLWEFLQNLKRNEEVDASTIPDEKPGSQQIQQLAMSTLKKNKGNGYAGRLIEICKVIELPKSIVNFLQKVYDDFPAPSINMNENVFEKTADESEGEYIE